MVSGKQLTICWHMDDLKITRGKIHDYLGMTLHFSIKRKVKVLLMNYLKETIKDFLEVIDESAFTPAAHYLHDVNSN
eukprot:3398584-Ditylum_brightwellii.AAC.1